MQESTYQITSPFLEKAQDSYANRHKHTRKIRKYAERIRFSQHNQTVNNKKSQNKKYLPNKTIEKSLAERNIPKFLLQLIKNTKITNSECIPKIGLGYQIEKLKSLPFIIKRCRQQEEELQALIQENSARFEQRRQIERNMSLHRNSIFQTSTDASTIVAQNYYNENSSQITESGEEDASFSYLSHDNDNSDPNQANPNLS